MNRRSAALHCVSSRLTSVPCPHFRPIRLRFTPSRLPLLTVTSAPSAALGVWNERKNDARDRRREEGTEGTWKRKSLVTAGKNWTMMVII